MTPANRPTYPTDRLGALSDGVFAIVLTLLVLDLKIPKLPGPFAEQELHADLAAQIPNFVAWLISFVLLARFWIVHHAVISALARCHTGTLVRNLAVLGLASLIPFAASLIGTYEFDGLAVGIFTGTLAITGVAIGSLAHHVATETPLHKSGEIADLNWHWKYHLRALPALAVVGFLLITIDEVAAVAVWAFEPLLAFVARFRRHT